MAASFEDGANIHSTDHRGRIICPEVLSVAYEIKNQLIGYGEKVLRDPALAASLLEESAAAVSRVLTRHPGDNTIRNLHAYLFRTFLRRVNRIRRAELRLLRGLTAQYRESNPPDQVKRLELEILVNEILSRGDAVMRDMFFRRSQGCSWKEIGSAYGISAHAAESRFSQALGRLRKKLGV